MSEISIRLMVLKIFFVGLGDFVMLNRMMKKYMMMSMVGIRRMMVSGSMLMRVLFMRVLMIVLVLSVVIRSLVVFVVIDECLFRWCDCD